MQNHARCNFSDSSRLCAIMKRMFLMSDVHARASPGTLGETERERGKRRSYTRRESMIIDAYRRVTLR